MFRKKPNIKPLYPVRSSDRRKLLSAILTAFSLDPLTLPPETKEQILPSDIRTGKFIAHATGESGHLYVSADDGGRPLWLKLSDETLVPTVFTLWKCPFLVPIVLTWSPVIEKLRGGADMMLPGLIPPFVKGAVKGAVVAIASEERPTVPLAVGVCEIDLVGVTRVVGQHGKAILVKQCYGDELPVKGRISVPLELSLEVPRVETGDDADEKEVEQKSEEREEKDAQTDTTSDQKVEDEKKIEEEKVLENETDIADALAELLMADDTPQETSDTAVKDADPEPRPKTSEVEDEGPSTEEIDNAFHRALLATIFDFRTGSLDLTFPQPSSTFISAHLLRHLPAYFSSAQMKQTSWKKAAKFLKAMEKEGLLKVKEKGGDVTIMSVAGVDHAQLKTFQPFKTAGGRAGESSTGGSNPTKLTLKEYYQIREKAKQIAEAVGRRTGSGFYYTAAELRAIVVEYIAKEELVDASNPREVKLNPVLAGLVAGSGPKPRKLTREALIEAYRNACVDYYLILRDDENEREGGKLSKGSPPKIQLQVVMKQGHKVTKITNLETYKFDVAELANELRVECASSTTVSRSLEGTGGGGRGKLEVLVQGPQDKTAVEVLERHGVRRTWIEVKDGTKKKR
ncbi:hypothetical protein BZA70DRAFT_300772 [Myxozyma melibiosi]|uniref:SUI1 domain-containing protein n=1 Tax=Myxozyma melibiosi TaxID=54550 RepID=A0ABR1FDZ3_9ASCO